MAGGGPAAQIQNSNGFLTIRNTYVFCGGGSGGHLYPGIAVADQLLQRDQTCRIVFIGSLRKIESEILAAAGYEHVPLDILPASDILRSPFKFVRKHRTAVSIATRLLKDRCPRAVIGLGGFASVPVVTAASKLRCPIVLLEQNRVAGRATLWLSRKAHKVCLSFPETTVGWARPEIILTGNPVRESIVAVRESEPGSNLLVLGGSQGARGLNDLVLSILDDPSRLPQGWQVVHQTGASDESRVRAHYETVGIPATVTPFIHDMPKAYADSGLVISRAGGTTLAELTTIGRAAILVPIPKSVRDHQNANASCFVEVNAARLLRQDTADKRAAAEVLSELLASPDQREDLARAMKVLGYPDAAASVARIVSSLTNNTP